MKFRIFINFYFLIFFSVLSGWTASEDEVFISMTGDSRYPAVAVEGKKMYIVWLLAEGKNTNLYFKRSSDEGETWNSARKISNEKSDCLPPALAVNSGIVHVAWVDYAETINGEIYYTRSIDGGDNWEKNFIIVKDANHARYPSLVCQDNNVYLIWQDGENRVFFKASYDKGRTWQNDIIIGKVGTHSCFCFPPAFTVNGKELIIAWTDMRRDNRGLSVRVLGFPIFQSNEKNVTIANSNKQMVSSVICRRSSDNGRTWGKERLLARCKVPKEMKDEIDNPIMVSDGSLSHIFWLDRRNVELGELFWGSFYPSEQQGFITGKNIYPTPKRSPKRPSVAIDRKGNLHITWATFFGGKSVIHYGAIDSKGNEIRKIMNMTTEEGRFHCPAITINASGVLYLFWFDESQDKEQWSRIFLKISRDYGLTWENWEPNKKDM